MNIGIDLDGTIYRSNTLIPGSKYAIDKLIENNNLFFLTNNGSTPPTAILKKLNSLLDLKLEDKQIITPLLVAINYLSNLNKLIYVHADPNVKSYLKSFNLKITDDLENSEIALIGRISPFNDKLIKSFVDFYNNNGIIYAFNKDMTYPTDKGFEIGNGALVKEIEEIIDSEINSFGKPEQFYIDYLKKHSINLHYVVGDRVDTDIELGRAIGCHSVLVKTGVYNEADDVSNIPALKIFNDLKSFSNSI